MMQLRFSIIRHSLYYRYSTTTASIAFIVYIVVVFVVVVAMAFFVRSAPVTSTLARANRILRPPLFGMCRRMGRECGRGSRQRALTRHVHLTSERRSVPVLRLQHLRHISSTATRTSTNPAVAVEAAAGAGAQTEQRSGLDMLGIAVLGSIVIGTAGLGSWQMKRYFWKGQLIEERAALLSVDPRSLEDLLEIQQSKQEGRDDATKALEFHRVLLTGEFDSSRPQVYLGPRPPPKSSSAHNSAAPAMAPSDKTGYYILAPFKLKSDESLLP